jgi:hypothetical protein
MSPELERLLQALHEKLTCPPEEKPHHVCTFDCLLNDALEHQPGISREQFWKLSKSGIANFFALAANPRLPPKA